MARQILFVMRAPSVAFVLFLSAIGSSTRAQAPDPEVSEYAFVIHSVIQRQWMDSSRHSALAPGSRCSARITQIPGGTVLEVDFFSDCDFDQAGRTAIAEAVYGSNPLPYEGFESVFQREIRMVFHAPRMEDPEASAARLAELRRGREENAVFEQIPRQQDEYKRQCFFRMLSGVPRVPEHRRISVMVNVDRSGNVVDVVGTGGELVEEDLTAALRAASSCEPVPVNLFIGAETIEVGPVTFRPGWD